MFLDGGGGGGGGIAAGLKFVGLVRVTPAKGVGLFNDSFKESPTNPAVEFRLSGEYCKTESLELLDLLISSILFRYFINFCWLYKFNPCNIFTRYEYILNARHCN